MTCFFPVFLHQSSSFRSSVFFVLYTVTAKRLRQFFELMKLCKQRRSGAACKVFLRIFLKSCRQCIRLVCLEIYRPFWGIGPKFLFYMVAYLMFPGIPFKRADLPLKTSMVFGSGVFIKSAASCCCARLLACAFLFHLLEYRSNSRTQYPALTVLLPV